MTLEERLFAKTASELAAYTAMIHAPDCTWAEKEEQRQRFRALYGLVCEAGLEDEYVTWEVTHK